MKAYRWISPILAVVLVASLLAATLSNCGEEEATPSPTPTPTPDYSAITEELSQLVQGAMDEAGVTGLSVALVDDQEMDWAEGFGYADKENGVEAAPETVYQLASRASLTAAILIVSFSLAGA